MSGLRLYIERSVDFFSKDVDPSRDSEKLIYDLLGRIV
jgi:hypothetical protein